MNQSDLEEIKSAFWCSLIRFGAAIVIGGLVGLILGFLLINGAI